MSPISIRLKKYGQLTNVFVDGKLAYSTAVVPKYEKQHLDMLFIALVFENIIVEVDE